MEFEKIVYVPILKWRRAEQGALTDITDMNKRLILPLLELVMPKAKGKQLVLEPDALRAELIRTFSTERAPIIADEVFAAWGTLPAYLDFTLLYGQELKMRSLKTVISNGQEKGMKLISVVNIFDDNEYIAAATSYGKQFGNGLCIRITKNELTNLSTLDMRLREILEIYGLKESGVDILLDLKEISDSLTYNNCIIQLQKLDNVLAWRTMIIASGSFPIDVSKCKIENDNMLPREEWVHWINARNTLKPLRMPVFADYTIRYPVHVEALQFFSSTASIKYTIDASWWVLKGVKGNNEQYLAHAAAMVESKNKRFYGAGFSAGDKYLADKAEYFPTYQKHPEKKGTGAAEQWIRMGINHHISVATKQLAS